MRMVHVGPPLTSTPAPLAPVQHEAPPLPPAEPSVAVQQRRRRYTFELPFDPELLPFLLLMGLALGLRLYDLGVKALHHDESLHAVYSWYLYQGRGYVHDPMMHGPLLFIANALAYLVLGANDATTRIMPALAGVAVVGLPWFLRRELGRGGAVAAAAIFAISPSYLYFSRFIRHDIYVVLFTLLMVIGVFRYLATGTKQWFYTSVVAVALLFATKEDVYISGFIPFTFLVGAWFLLRGEHQRTYRARIRALGWRPWLIGIAVFLAINLVLYTTFFTNPKGVCTALVTLPFSFCQGSVGALSYWLNQQDVRRGGQPWFYYLMLLPLYELLPLVLGALALFLVRARTLFYVFTIYWFFLAAAIYSWAGEKMPWMLPQIALPLVLAAARLLGDWSERGWGTRALSRRGAAVAGMVLLVAFGLLSWLGLGAASTVVPVDQQTVTLQRLALSLMIAIVAGGLVTLGARWGRAYVLPGVALGAMAILGVFYLRTSILVNYDHPDTPTEPLIYVQSSPDVRWIVQDIERVASETGQGKNLRILMDNGWGDGTHEAVAWPFEWYLRDYKNRRYYTRTIDPSINLADYPVILAMAPNIEPIRDQLADYQGQKYFLNWWFPEDYKQFAGDGPRISLGPIAFQVPTLRFDLIGRTLADPQNRVKLLKFLLYREAPNELAGREMYYYVRNSIPRFGPAPTTGSAPAGTTAPAAPSGAREAIAQPGADGTTVFGRNAAGAAALVDPKNVAVAPNGKLYVVEGRAGRVTSFNADGSIAGSWGSPGAGDGQFQEPWGVAVAPDGSVYVADTWNHRIQRFSADGQFLGKWGRLGDAKGQTSGTDGGTFWGPRSIAITPDGEVFVTDTGNKRVQVFDLEGNFRRMFGGEGSAPGQFREPVGIAADADGSVWVADAWNSRIQHLDRDGVPLGAFGVAPGWENPSITNKAYLAVAPGQRIVATYPDDGRVVVFGRDGQEERRFQVPGNGSAVGVALGTDGRIFVADARSGVVLAYPRP